MPTASMAVVLHSSPFLSEGPSVLPLITLAEERQYFPILPDGVDLAKQSERAKTGFGLSEELSLCPQGATVRSVSMFLAVLG